MRMRWFVWMCIAVIGIIAGVAHADKAEDTAVLVEKAVIMFKEQGSATTIKAINDPQGPFVKGEIYVFALTMDNVLGGHPFDVSSRRISLRNMKDNNGVQVFQKLKEIAEKDGS